MHPFREGVFGEQFAAGSHATVHRLHTLSGSWIVKVGMTDVYRPPFLHRFGLSLPRKKASKFFEKMLGKSFRFEPDMDFIMNGLEEFRLIKRYFSYDPEDGYNVRQVLSEDLGNENSDFYQHLKKVLKNGALLEIAGSVFNRHMKDNFIPEEQLIVGHPPGGIVAGQSHCTYYLIQKCVAGDDIVELWEINDEDLRSKREITEKLLVFSLLQRKMYFDTRRLIDTRPEEVAKYPTDWFTKTSNILVDRTKQDIHFIDTRWLWDGNSILGSRGLNLIEWLGVRSVDKAIKKYLRILAD